jgi:hypothetical protein
METFEFLVTSTVQATLYEHIKIQALNYEDAVTRIEDRDYYEEDGEIVDSKTEIDDYLEVDDISNWEDIVKSNPKFMEKYGFKPRKTYNPIDFFVFKDYDKELLLALLIGIIDGDGSIQPNGSSNAFCITITAHESWTQFYQEFMETLDIPEHISNREGSTTIRICRREILQLLQDVITNNNLFHLKRKWNKLMIKEPSASES